MAGTSPTMTAWWEAVLQLVTTKESPMPRHAHYVPHGVIPAVLLPFNDDLSIDEKSFRSHLRDVAATPGISAITINAHSTEATSRRCPRYEASSIDRSSWKGNRTAGITPAGTNIEVS